MAPSLGAIPSFCCTRLLVRSTGQRARLTPPLRRAATIPLPNLYPSLPTASCRADGRWLNLSDGPTERPAPERATGTTGRRPLAGPNKIGRAHVRTPVPYAHLI